jgi:cell wall-associated NlpC family hydrolase
LAYAKGQLEAILQGIGAKVTPQNLKLLQGWQQAEGGSASYNPFNTTQSAPGAGSYNSVGVRNYTNSGQGTQATIKTLLNGRYGNILADLKAGNAAPGKFAADVGASPWGTSGQTLARVLGSGLAPPSPTAPPHPTTSKAPTQSLKTPTLTPGSDPTQARQTLLAYLMTNGATQASGQAGGDPNAGLVSLLTSMPPPSMGLAQQPQLKVKASTPEAAAKANTNPNVSGIVNIAKKYLGTPYSWGGGTTKGPSKGFAQGANTVGFDCSSFVQFVTHQATGKTIPRTTYQQYKAGTPVPKGKLQPGDAVYFEPGAQGPGHVGMYIGGGQFIESPHTGATIRISNLNQRSDFVGARRFT